MASSPSIASLATTRLSTYPSSIISPTWAAQDLKQVTGRIHRSGCKSPVIQTVVYAQNTLEERVMSVVRRKLANLQAITDNDLGLA